uniref:Serine aminopeptidase S33 domain-containing protein n=1 Tax=Chromera velia CCMP2878 TaxID=1169474 RepID=A0A0G4HHF2_9ALVE|mmetsp:Transcript_17750/g.36057  ORF Transcript_17750/g.36057 Transcript_17750/m.36057 type:complete len:541 (-) Transcript_17750:131-1753(-)|eukprot:Cvel_27629.t1-p1 / transcript=Cvel_27629.t1 / gene=Cvel_27629 / organism=Chromera_velia_CCMP2878 / gene_product=Monoglyceride lipase, putative / transcript_product=Monoglyceride lipase, putative / location=Cvel_scaffold3476:7961-12340(+) / protein_length=540 / sequence_SO=supercontig / SO=protein_coding / is_pseudo=false
MLRFSWLPDLLDWLYWTYLVLCRYFSQTVVDDVIVVLLILVGLASIMNLISYRLDGRPRKGRWADPNKALYSKLRIRHKPSYWTNRRGKKLFTQRWLPVTHRIRKPKALVFICHGYGDHCNFFLAELAAKFCKEGYAVVGIDYEGHGLSEGCFGLIENFGLMVQDVADFFNLCRRKWKSIPAFVYGESMGGAVALTLHLNHPELKIDGMMLMAPMCKIMEEMKPHAAVEYSLNTLANYLPHLPIVPTPEFASKAYRDEEKRQRAAKNVLGYNMNPRLQTAAELLRTTDAIQRQMHKVSLPLLIIHGSDDKITDPAISKLLYEQAASVDKTLKIYDGAWHCLHQGEPDEISNRVVADMVHWLSERDRVRFLDVLGQRMRRVKSWTSTWVASHVPPMMPHVHMPNMPNAQALFSFGHPGMGLGTGRERKNSSGSLDGGVAGDREDEDGRGGGGDFDHTPSSPDKVVRGMGSGVLGGDGSGTQRGLLADEPKAFSQGPPSPRAMSCASWDSLGEAGHGGAASAEIFSDPCITETEGEGENVKR